MAVLFDASILLLTIQPDVPPPHDPNTGQPLKDGKQRVDYLIHKLSEEKTKIIIPTPALSEALVYYTGEETNSIILNLQKPPFHITPFDIHAAVECAETVRDAGCRGNKTNNSRAKVKFDRQIIAIAQVEEVKTIYSDDEDIYKYGTNIGLKVTRSYQLELDPNDRQGRLALDAVTHPTKAGLK
jgi:hypothetical protein